MHEFRTLLATFLRQNHWTQQHLAGLLDADQATVSRWLSGRVQMGGDTLAKLLSLVPDGQKSVLLETYLRDQIPEGCDYLVNLSPVGADTARLKPQPLAEPEFPKAMDPQLKRRLVFFSNLAMGSPDVRKLIDVVYKLASRGKI
jgi:transcriptional regulator with XRE-family HTH domain